MARIKNIIILHQHTNAYVRVPMYVYLCVSENMYVLCVLRVNNYISLGNNDIEIRILHVRLLKRAHAQNTLESRNVTIFLY